MSRVKRLQERRRKRKNKIKTTSCCLILALAMGISQGIGTYALFTDNEDVPSDISLSTGDVDVEVSKGTDFTDLKPGDEKYIDVEITNKGTLNQNISLDFSTSEDIRKYLECDFIFDGIDIKKGVMYNGEKLFVLAPGESRIGKAKITVLSMTRDEQNNLCGTKKNVDITVKSTQISKDNTLFNSGFYDVAIQRNTITIAQKEVISIATGEKAYFTNGGGNSFKKLYIPINVKSTTSEVTLKSEVVSNSGTHTYTATYDNYPPYGDYILIESQNNKDELPFKGVVNITITVTVKDGQTIETYNLKCNVTLNNAGNACSDDHPDHYEGPGSGNGHKCHGEIVYSGHKTITTISEEVEETIEAEVQETQKEEPSKLEVVEQLKEEVEKTSEPEAIEPSKEEIVEEQKQPEVIEPPRETEGL